MPVFQAAEERFLLNIRSVGECLEWTGDRMWAGYGRIQVAGRSVRTHRFAWEMNHGPIPAGLWVLHHCDNRACVKIDHLFLGDPLDNVRDMIAKGRKVPGRGKQMGSTNAAARVDDRAVRLIRLLASKGVPQAEIASQAGITQSQVGRIVRRQSWPHVK